MYWRQNNIAVIGYEIGNVSLIVNMLKEMGVSAALVSEVEEIKEASEACKGKGYDLELVKHVTGAVSIPVIACSGAKDIHDFKRVIFEGSTHAAAVRSL